MMRLNRHQKGNLGVAVADVARALGLVVGIVPAWVRTLQGAPTKNGLWVDPPPHRRWPNDPKQDVSGRPAHDS